MGRFQGLMGDADCNLNVNSVDALKTLLRRAARVSNGALPDKRLFPASGSSGAT
jgi:hypothetical protein